MGWNDESYKYKKQSTYHSNAIKKGKGKINGKNNV